MSLSSTEEAIRFGAGRSTMELEKKPTLWRGEKLRVMLVATLMVVSGTCLTVALVANRACKCEPIPQAEEQANTIVPFAPEPCQTNNGTSNQPTPAASTCERSRLAPNYVPIPTKMTSADSLHTMVEIGAYIQVSYYSSENPNLPPGRWYLPFSLNSVVAYDDSSSPNDTIRYLKIQSDCAKIMLTFSKITDDNWSLDGSTLYLDVGSDKPYFDACKLRIGYAIKVSRFGPYKSYGTYDYACFLHDPHTGYTSIRVDMIVSHFVIDFEHTERAEHTQSTQTRNPYELLANHF